MTIHLRFAAVTSFRTGSGTTPVSRHQCATAKWPAPGLDEAFTFASGKTDGSRIREIELPDIDVARICRKTGLSQSEFAKSIGVAKGILLSWEHGRRCPTGPAQVLLAHISKNPAVDQKVLR